MRRAQWSVVWKRVDSLPKRKRYWSRAQAEHRALLLGPEPWLYEMDRWEKKPKDPDSRMCCDGYVCGCGGLTVRQHYEQRRAELVESGMPPVEWVRIERRTVEVTPWEEV